MDLELTGKTVLVTGSTRGLGRYLAEAFREEGCQIIINGRDLSAVSRVAAELGGDAIGIAADVTDPEQCRQLRDEVGSTVGRLDILVCNVGSGASVPPGQETPEEWRRVFDLNIASATNVVEVMTEMLAKHNGSIVCISSICGLEVLGAPVTYSSAKAALNAYVRGIARPLALKGIRISAVAPGNILFGGSVWQRKLAEDPKAVQAMLEREVAQQRLGSPGEVADTVMFLSSVRSSFTTGAIFVVDGGQVRS